MQNLGLEPGGGGVVQILVVVENIQMRTLKAEEGKVPCEWHLHGLVDPKRPVPLTPGRTHNRIRSPR
ncbi:unnamed protein product [Brassica napus]|uniref:(rape) hypothetical protein n=1 Tax=Brassica napus TaxID=3708 RepID=A0A816THF9_BRANA|nr:unnamed protein product [Brassica napus]